MAWFTFYWTLNLAALAFLFNAGASDANILPHWLIAAVFAVMNVPSSISSFYMLGSMKLRCDRSDRLFGQLVQGTGEVETDDLRARLWPRGFAAWSFIINGLCTLTLAFVWGVAALNAITV